jgi:hypothetical protein
MKHVSICGLRLRALVLSTALAAAALAFASPAMALSVFAVQPTGTFDRDQATTDEWTGAIQGAAAPDDCVRVNDPNNTNPFFQCSVHDTNPQDDGTAEVVIMLDTLGVDPESQSAVAVFRCVDPIERDPLTGDVSLMQTDNATCTQIAFRDQSLNPQGLQQLRVTFPVTGDDPAEPVDTVFYEVRVIPILTTVEITYTACAGYIDNGADPCPNDEALDVAPPPGAPGVFPASQFLACTDPGNSGNRRMTGSGQIGDDDNKTERVSVSVRQRAEKPNSPQGQVNHRFFPTKQKFHSKRLACARFNDETKKLEVRGIGWTKVDGQKPRKVCFVAHFQDNPADTNQKGNGDNFDLTTVLFFRNDPNTTADDACGSTSASPDTHGGTITKGNFRYRISDRGNDSEYDEYDRDNSYAKDTDYDWSYGG